MVIYIAALLHKIMHFYNHVRRDNDTFIPQPVKIKRDNDY